MGEVPNWGHSGLVANTFNAAPPPSETCGGFCYHAMSRGNRRETVFHDEADYEAFVAILRRASERIPMRLRLRSGVPDVLLTSSPVPLGDDWCEQVNRPLTAQELDAVRTSVQRGRPFGEAAWTPWCPGSRRSTMALRWFAAQKRKQRTSGLSPECVLFYASGAKR